MHYYISVIYCIINIAILYIFVRLVLIFTYTISLFAFFVYIEKFGANLYESQHILLVMQYIVIDACPVP